MSALLSILGFVCAVGLIGGPGPAHAAVTAYPTVPTVTAHPLGGFSVNRYNGLVVAPHEVRIDHVEDLAEIPTAQVKAELTSTGPAAWAARRCTDTARAMRISIDGRQRESRVRSARADLRSGQAGLNTLRIECSITAAGSGSSVTFRDGGPRGSAGWREITARADGMTLTSADVPASSRSTRLTDYPKDVLSSPPDRSTATLRVRPGGPALADRPDAGVRGPGPAALPGIDPLTGSFGALVAGQRLTPAFASLALLIALALGALHALAPGHGKTIMAAHAVTRAGDRGTSRDTERPDRNRPARIRREVLTLGLTVTITHTAGVLVLGLLIASGSLPAPAAVYPWLGVASGVLIVIAGAASLRRARLNARTRVSAHGHGHTHGHGHGRGHGHTHGHAHAHGEGHTHGPVKVPLPRRGEAVLMGFGGGLVPSPSAVLVLVGAAAIGQAWFGVVLVLAYGIGLASSLVLIGLLVVGSGRSLARRLGSIADARPGSPWRRHRLVPLLLTERFRHLVPMGAAGAVLTVGSGLILRNLLAAFA